MGMKVELLKTRGNNVLLLLTLFIISACHQSTKIKGVESNKYIVNQCNNDTLINNLISLNDSISFHKYLLKKSKKKYYDDWLYFSSKNKEQYIGLQTNYGGREDEYKRFEVSYIQGNYNMFIPLKVKQFFDLNKDKNKFSFIPSDIDNFTTESGIKLGMSEEEFKNLTKNKVLTLISDAGITIYNYLDDNCLYDAKYEFKNQKLMRFEFGYMTP